MLRLSLIFPPLAGICSYARSVMSPRHEQRQAAVVIRRGSELVYVNDLGLARDYLFADAHQGKELPAAAGQLHEEPRALDAIHALALDIQERLATTVGKHCPNLKDGIYWARKQGIVTQDTLKKLTALNTTDSFIKHYTSAAGKELIDRLSSDCQVKQRKETEGFHAKIVEQKVSAIETEPDTNGSNNDSTNTSNIALNKVFNQYVEKDMGTENHIDTVDDFRTAQEVVTFQDNEEVQVRDMTQEIPQVIHEPGVE